jgi:uncharacterized BrkB/YihY/UPF0761 family membrane protein
MRGLTTALVLFALFGIAYLIVVAVLDPLSSTVLAYNLGGMGSQVENIHIAAVKYTVPVFLGSVVLWAVFWILRRERQTVR